MDDCELVSNHLSRVFMVEGIDYERMEVSSPGVDRPLKRANDWRRFVGVPVHVELYEPLKAEGFPEAGRRKLDGRILEVTGQDGQEMITFSFEQIEQHRTPSEAARAKKLKAKTPAAEPVVVTFALADVDRANLIPQLDFRG